MYGPFIEYEGQMAERFRREVTYPAAARRACLLRTAALMQRGALPATAGAGRSAAMDAIVGIISLVAGLIGLGLAAWRWGADSRDGVDSPEWERRRAWRGFGGH
jgi:hypothetical protein